MGTNAAAEPRKATDDALDRTRALLGPRYARQAGLDPSIQNLSRDTRRIIAGSLSVTAFGLAIGAEGAIVLLLASISALLVRAWFIGNVVKNVEPERVLEPGELADWAARVLEIAHPPSSEVVETALSALRHPRTTVIDLARQCANIAAFEAAARRRARMRTT